MRCGVDRAAVTFGHVVSVECERLGITVEDYLAAYDPSEVSAFAGADDLVRSLDRWAVCSNKTRHHGRLELAALGWEPELAMFADDFGGPKRLGPVLDAMGLQGSDVVFVGDTAHDRLVAREVGAVFALAGWNRRAEAEPGDEVLVAPADLLRLL